MAQKRKSDFFIHYVTITYRSVLLGGLGVIALAAIVLYFVFPGVSNKVASATQNLFEKALVRSGLANNPSANGSGAEPGPQQAHFTNIDGAVKVKKRSTNTWVSADYSVGLETGDVVQTSSEGIAKVVFTDGTNYTVKPDSLIVVQDNSVNSAQQTSVAVQVTTGTVDLATSSISSGSKSQVIVAGATATLSPETSAEVLNDPRADTHEILVKKGSGEVNRNGETVKMSELERVSFKADSTELKKSKEIGPPVLIDPPNMQPVFVGTKGRDVNFSWAPVPNVPKYRIRISKNPYFSSLMLDAVVESPQSTVNGFEEGGYYWEVQSIGEDGKESVASEKNRFTIIPKGADKVDISLELEPFVQHGHVIEVLGRTEPGSRVMVNGQEVAGMRSDGSFAHFTTPLPTGLNKITVTVQNTKGGVNTKTQDVIIQ